MSDKHSASLKLWNIMYKFYAWSQNHFQKNIEISNMHVKTAIRLQESLSIQESKIELVLLHI